MSDTENRHNEISLPLTLDALKSGERAEIAEVAGDTIRAQAMRLGIFPGVEVSCLTKIPAGPIVIGHGRQEIAVGRGLARRIAIRRIPARGRA